MMDMWVGVLPLVDASAHVFDSRVATTAVFAASLTVYSCCHFPAPMTLVRLRRTYWMVQEPLCGSLHR